MRLIVRNIVRKLNVQVKDMRSDISDETDTPVSFKEFFNIKFRVLYGVSFFRLKIKRKAPLRGTLLDRMGVKELSVHLCCQKKFQERLSENRLRNLEEFEADDNYEKIVENVGHKTSLLKNNLSNKPSLKGDLEAFLKKGRQKNPNKKTKIKRSFVFQNIKSSIIKKDPRCLVAIKLKPNEKGKNILDLRKFIVRDQSPRKLCKA